MKRVLDSLQQNDIQKVLQSPSPRSVIVHGHVLGVLKNMPDSCVQCVITSPPYWGLREYGTELQVWGGKSDCKHKWEYLSISKRSGGYNEWSKSRYMIVPGSTSIEQPLAYICSKCGAWQGSLGLEPSPDMYIDHLVSIFAEVRRTLRDDGVCWLNIDDTYAHGAIGRTDANKKYKKLLVGENRSRRDTNISAGNLHLIPARLALALQSDGWCVRDTIVWVKMWQDDTGVSSGTVMPGGTGSGRFTPAWEYIFQLTKSSKYYFDLDSTKTIHRSNLRNVFRVNIQPYPGDHIAPFPEGLVSPLLLASTSGGSCPECRVAYVREDKFTYQTGWRPNCECFGKMKKITIMEKKEHRFLKRKRLQYVWNVKQPPPFPCVVLDPFAGSGTVGQVALRNRRSFIGIELNPASVKEAEERIRNRWTGKRGRG